MSTQREAFALSFAMILIAIPIAGWTPEIATPISSTSQLAQVQHDPYFIGHDSDFAYYGFPGSGTQDDPYVIENLIIGTASPCITIRFVEAYFIIRNCIMDGYSLDTDYVRGVIDLIQSKNGRIQNCLINGGDYGIMFYRCTNIEIDRCRITNTTTASIYSANSALVISYCNFTGGGILEVETDYSDPSSLEVSNCLLNEKILGYFKNQEGLHLDGGQFGQILLHNCTDSEIMNVNITMNANAIFFFRCMNCTLTSASVSTERLASVYCYYSEGLTLKDNSLSGGSILIEGNEEKYWHHRIENNTLNQKRIMYYLNVNDLQIIDEEIGQTIIVASAYVDIIGCYSLGSSCPIMVAFCSNIVIDDVSIQYSNLYGIYAFESADIAIMHSKVNDGTGSGCFIENCEAIQIFDSLFEGSQFGLYTWSCFDLNITWNAFVSMTHTYSYGCNMIGTEDVLLRNNSIMGRHGLYISDSSGFVIESNEFLSCQYTALSIFNSAEGEISGNRFYDCEYGINIQTASMLHIDRMALENCTEPLSVEYLWSSSISSCKFIENKNSVRFMYVFHSEITDCIVSSAGNRGFSFHYLAYTIISNCNVSEARESGIVLASAMYSNITECMVSHCSDSGIVLEDSTYVNIKNTASVNNTKSGMEFHNTQFTKISNNAFSHNSEYGLLIESTSMHNTISKNLFENNIIGNAKDDGVNNTWDENSWSDWTGGENYYAIPGDGGAVDHHPKRILTEIDNLMVILGPSILAVTVLLIAIPLSRRIQNTRWRQMHNETYPTDGESDSEEI